MLEGMLLPSNMKAAAPKRGKLKIWPANKRKIPQNKNSRFGNSRIGNFRLKIQDLVCKILKSQDLKNSRFGMPNVRNSRFDLSNMENSRFGNSGFGLPNIENARFTLPLSKIKTWKVKTDLVYQIWKI